MPGNTSQLNNHKVKAIALNIAAFLTKKIAHFFESLSHSSKQNHPLKNRYDNDSNDFIKMETIAFIKYRLRLQP